MGKLNKKGMEMKLAFKNEMKDKRKIMKNVLKAKRAKLIVRNLPFKATEENLKSHFEKFGEVESVNILKKPDGKKVGCAFIQYKLVQKAAKAKHHLNGKAFLDRLLEVDFTKSKDKYKKEKKVRELEVKSEKEENDVDLSIVKVEDESVNVEIKDETEDIASDLKSDNSENESETREDNSETDDEDLQIDNKDSTKLENEDKTDIKKPHVMSNDVSEGKTVFIKNVPFSATNEELKSIMSQYGPVYYALICIDRLTEHSKGTAFVKFRNKEDAEKSLAAGTELTLQGNILDCHAAMHKNDLLQKGMDKKVKQKDSRNLYLVKEGVILAGTNASQGVSSSDMAKRLQLEQYKTQMLRNLNMYIARTRLIIHNLPPTWNDTKLRTLFKDHSSPNAVIREAKIMRDLRNVDSKGIGKSKEYGFVSFTNHEDALKALRSLNNNPKIFAENRRPIVAFSIENRAILKAKEKRLQRSKFKNPKCKDYTPNLDKTEDNSSYKDKRQFENIEKERAVSKFTGVTATPGIKKMRSKFNLKTQAKLHFENLKKEKKKNKKKVKTLKEKRQEFTKQPKQKINKKEETDNFSMLVNKYKLNLKSVHAKTTKWYE